MRRCCCRWRCWPGWCYDELRAKRRRLPVSSGFIGRPRSASGEGDECGAARKVDVTASRGVNTVLDLPPGRTMSLLAVGIRTMRRAAFCSKAIHRAVNGLAEARSKNRKRHRRIAVVDVNSNRQTVSSTANVDAIRRPPSLQERANDSGTTHGGGLRQTETTTEAGRRQVVMWTHGINLLEGRGNSAHLPTNGMGRRFSYETARRTPKWQGGLR